MRNTVLRESGSVREEQKERLAIYFFLNCGVFRDAPLNDGILSQAPPPFTHDILFAFPLYPVPSLVYTEGWWEGNGVRDRSDRTRPRQFVPNNCGHRDGSDGGRQAASRAASGWAVVAEEFRACVLSCCNIGPSTYKGACVESSGAVCQHRVVDVRRPTTDVRVLF